MGNQSSRCFQFQKDSDIIPDEDVIRLRKIGFDITEEIGRGSFGTVYHGLYTESALNQKDNEGNDLVIAPGQEFVVKYINIKDREEQELKSGKSTIREFCEREKQFLTKLSNPYIVQFRMCVHLGECRFIQLPQDPTRPLPQNAVRVRPSYDRLYLIMDFADFGSLANYLNKMITKNLALSESQAKSWCRQMGLGIQYLHQQNIIHGDIKSDNILLFSEYNQYKEVVIIAKLCDFGLTRYQNAFIPLISEEYFDEYPSEHVSTDPISSSDEELLISGSNSSGFSAQSSLPEELGDIYELSIVFDRVIQNTNFSDPQNRELAQQLVTRMQNLNPESLIGINSVLSHRWLSHDFRTSSMGSSHGRQLI